MEKINIAKLLKNCPKGMELDCILFNNPVKLDEIVDIDENPCPITVITVDGDVETFTKYGQYLNRKNAKCLIFPKGKTTWEGFVPPVEFKDGDVLHIATGEGDYSLCIIDCIIGDTLYTKASCSYSGHFLCTCEEQVNIEELVVMRFATEEEKQILFDAIKDNGYKWNAETNTLEKLIKPKFKVGDKVRNKNNHNVAFTITNIEEDSYVCGAKSAFWFDDQDNYELVPNKFDINTLKPFDQVLVRNTNNGHWWGEFYLTYGKNKDYPFECTYNCWAQCIPYKGNEHLLDKIYECDEYYKIW